MEFQKIAKKSEIKEGTIKSFKLYGKEIALSRVGDAFFAFDNLCTHAGCSLHNGQVEGTHIICPCHGGTFNMKDGSVVALPPEKPLTTYPIRIVGDDILIQL